jgi:metallo-beta-lactamase class B
MYAKTLAFFLAASLTAWSTPALAQQPDDQKAWTETCKDWDEWDTPGPPFKVFGNTYYVGTCGISAILITGETRHMLIDSGTEAGARIVAANIEKLGFKLTDVRFLLSSHEHHDHVGGMEYLRKVTGGIVMVNSTSAAIYSSGNVGTDDPQLGENPPLPRIVVGGKVEDGVTMNLGFLKVKAIATPGHTPGAMSWTWKSCEGDDCRTIVYADSLTPVSSDDYRFSDHAEYVAAFRKSLDKVAVLDCDILLSPHPSASGMRDKLLAGDLTGGMNCREYAEGLRERLETRLAREVGANQ